MAKIEQYLHSKNQVKQLLVDAHSLNYTVSQVQVDLFCQLGLLSLFT